MKKIYSFVLLILVSVIANISVYHTNAADVSSQWSVARLFFEPFYAFSHYVLTMQQSGSCEAVISWLFWLIFAVILFAKYKEINLKKTVIYCLFCVLFFVSMVYAVIVLPISRNGDVVISPDGNNLNTVLYNITFYDVCREVKNIPSVKPADAAGQIKENNNFITHIFEPFFFLYNYITQTPLKYILSFYMFIFVVYSFLYKVPFFKIVKSVSLIMPLFFSAGILYFIKIINCNYFIKAVVYKTVIPASLSFIVLWFAVWSLCEKDF